jgi:hypothetical protein
MLPAGTIYLLIPKAYSEKTYLIVGFNFLI